MAIFHFSVKAIGRSAGYSAVAAAAYRSGERLTDERTGETHDYRKRGGVECVTMHLPAGVPGMARSELWNKAETAEKKSNSTVARECEVSLPNELSKETKIKLANELAQHLSNKYCCAVDVAVHKPTVKNNEKNDHAHLLMTTRSINQDGEMGAKCRVLDVAKTGSVEILEWRKYWADICNRELALAGFSERIDHRSFKDQGLEKLPTIHHGNSPKTARIKAQNAAITELNGINAELAVLLKERAEMVSTEIAEAATSAAADDVTQALDSLEKTTQTPIEAVATEDLAGSPLTPAEIETLRQELAQPPAPTHQELQAALTHAEVDATKARQTLPNAHRGRDIARAKAALPEAIEAAKAATQSLAKVEHELENLPWWRPFKKRALIEALEQAKLLKQRTNDDMQELKVTAKAPDHDAIMADFLAAKERAKGLKATLDAMPTKTQTPEPAELKRDAISALLLSNAARAAAAAKANIIDGKPK